MSRARPYNEFTTAEREAFDKKYGPPSQRRVSLDTPGAMAYYAAAAGIALGPDSPLRPSTGGKVQKRGHEDKAHMEVIRWADSPAVRDVYPDLHWLFHAANGGNRDAATAGKMKAMGVRRGVPDLLLPVPRGRFCGLAIELKVWKGSPLPADPSDPTKYRTMPSANQLDWLSHLTTAGWSTSVQWGAHAAIEALREYLTLPTP
jgi:hypothetical protein